MCTPNTEIQFCTCASDDELQNKNIYVWSLYRYLGHRESKLRGKIMLPTTDFQNGISVENITSKLNKGNIFDFEYQPSEGDTLHISFNSENYNDYVYFSLIFKGNNWKEGNNPAFVSVKENIAKGEVKIMHKD